MNMQQKFEQWWAAEFIKSGSQVMIDDDFRKDADGQYEKVIVRRAWLAYQAGADSSSGEV